MEISKNISDIYIFGSSGAIPSAERDNIFLALQCRSLSMLVDCAGSPVTKLQKVGISPKDLDVVLLTHSHPDHIYGLPSLFQVIGLIGRKKALQIWGPEDVIYNARQLLKVFDLGDLLITDVLDFRIICTSAEQMVYEDSQISIWTFPVVHSVPTLAVKFQNNHSKKSITYSSDTGPCDGFAQFATGSDVLIHECSFPSHITSPIHSNPLNAGRIAEKAQVKKLVLVHLPVLEYDVSLFPIDAKREFSGEVEIPADYQRYEF